MVGQGGGCGPGHCMGLEIRDLACCPPALPPSRPSVHQQCSSEENLQWSLSQEQAIQKSTEQTEVPEAAGGKTPEPEKEEESEGKEPARTPVRRAGRGETASSILSELEGFQRRGIAVPSVRMGRGPRTPAAQPARKPHPASAAPSTRGSFDPAPTGCSEGPTWSLEHGACVPCYHEAPMSSDSHEDVAGEGSERCLEPGSPPPVPRPPPRPSDCLLQPRLPWTSLPLFPSLTCPSRCFLPSQDQGNRGH